VVSVTSTHWGGHHGPEAALLLGVGGAGGVEGKPSTHYQTVENTCVTCHLGGAGPDASHTFTPNVATCQTCHADATSLDVNGVQTEVQGKLDQVEKALIAKGLLAEVADPGLVELVPGFVKDEYELTTIGKAVEPVVGDYPEAQAAALWNYLFVKEDKSLGVHNPSFANALLDAALEALK
jgi:hypothetical protein